MPSQLDANNNKVESKMSTAQPASIEKQPVEGIREFHLDFINWLYNDHGEVYNARVKQLEEITGTKREQIAYVLIILNCIYMMIGLWAEFMCNLIGFAYPAYKSVKAIRTEGTKDDTAWLIYWSVFATFSLMDYFAGSIMRTFPIYWVFKASFLMYLYLPQTKGSLFLYKHVVDPLVDSIDKLLEPKEVDIPKSKRE